MIELPEQKSHSSQKTARHSAKNLPLSRKSSASARQNLKKTLKSLFSALLLCVWTGLSLVISEYLIGYPLLWIFGSDTFNTTPVTTVYSILSYFLALFFALFLPYKLHFFRKPTREKLGLKGLPTWTDLGLAVVSIILSLLLAALLTKIFELFPWFNSEESQNLPFDSYLTGHELVLAFISLVIIAPIAEEILYRGLLYGQLRKNHSLIFSALLTSLTFAVCHGQWNVGVVVFAMSLVCCLLRETTGTIYAGILVHMLKNGLSFYLLYIIT